jgi:diaminohydroxyphosphoribosylaminopyrimidine deaminase/5-amino-6-(5-phosphoribosylamino)uracil reductase
MEDPNPLVSGAGFARLRDAGVEVDVGVLVDEARWANRAYVKAQTLGVPWVDAKIASTLDGKLATASGKSKYLTSEQSRKTVHKLRAGADAVLVGSGTILADDPLLDCRLTPRKIAPGVVVLDSLARTPKDSRLFSIRRRRAVVVAVGPNAAQEAKESLSEAGAEIWEVSESGQAHLSWTKLLRRCCQEGVHHLLVEGGARVFTSLLREGLVDWLSVFVAPMMIGGDGLDAVGPLGVTDLAGAPRFCLQRARTMGGDVMLELSPTDCQLRPRIINPKLRRGPGD